MKTSLSTPSMTETDQRGLLAFMRRHALLCYFFIAYTLSWLGWLPLVLSQEGLKLLPYHSSMITGILGGALGPIGAGFLMTAVTSGKAGVRQLLGRFLLWRVGAQWYLFTFAALPVLLLLSTIIIIPGAMASFHLSGLLSALLLYAGLFVVLMFVSPLAEEPGWRGFALPRLQKSYGPLKGTLLLGLLWGCWHLPLFLIPGYNDATAGFVGIAVPFGEFLLSILAGSVIFTWVFNHTRGSLLLAMMLHSSIDSFPLTKFFSHINTDGYTNLVVAISAGIWALLILIMTRGRLGYRED